MLLFIMSHITFVSVAADLYVLMWSGRHGQTRNLEAARNSPEAVLERFGAQPDPQDPKRNWKSHAGRITVTDGKFYNHDQEQGGGDQ